MKFLLPFILSFPVVADLQGIVRFEQNLTSMSSDFSLGDGREFSWRMVPQKNQAPSIIVTTEKKPKVIGNLTLSSEQRIWRIKLSGKSLEVFRSLIPPADQIMVIYNEEILYNGSIEELGNSPSSLLSINFPLDISTISPLAVSIWDLNAEGQSILKAPASRSLASESPETAGIDQKPKQQEGRFRLETQKPLSPSEFQLISSVLSVLIVEKYSGI